MASTRRPFRPRAWLAVASCLVLLACGTQQTVPDPAPDATESTASRSRALLELQATRDAGPGCIGAVGARGTVLWRSARGLADLEAGSPIDDSTVFELASVSKSVTATAVLLLERDGLLSTADPLSRHLDGLPAWSTRISLDQLMHHTSGIGDYYPERIAGDPAAVMSRREVLRWIAARSRLDFEPGSRWAYSNSNYVLLAEVVERVSGQSFPDFVRTRIFVPLQLSMVVSRGGPTPALARSYVPTAAGFESGTWRFYAMGAIGVRSTARDLLRWGEVYRPGSALGLDGWEEQWRDAPETGLESSRYGPGLFRLPDGTLYADGFYGGYRSGLLVSPDRERQAVLLCNRTAGVEPYDFLRGLARVWEFR